MEKTMRDIDLIIRRYFGDVSLEYSEVIGKDFIELPDGFRIKTDDIYFMDQIHSDIVVNLDDSPEMVNNVIPRCDGLITSLKGIFLAVKTADCFPILVYDEVRQVIAAIHSGCESTRLQILEVVLKIMYDRYSCKAENIKVEIGAGISSKNYQVSEEIVTDFRNTFGDMEIDRYLDLNKIIVDTALKNNILANNITACSDCTYDDSNYYSFRRDKTQKRQLSLIGMVYE